MWANELAGLNSQPSGYQLKLGTMTGPRSCSVGNLQLTSADLMIAEHLLQPVCVKVSETAPDGGGQCSDNSTYLSALKAGDTVLLYQLSDSKFLIIERMVSA